MTICFVPAVVAASFDFFCAQARASMRERVPSGTQLDGTIVAWSGRVAKVVAVEAVAGIVAVLVTVHLLLVLGFCGGVVWCCGCCLC